MNAMHNYDPMPYGAWVTDFHRPWTEMELPEFKQPVKLTNDVLITETIKAVSLAWSIPVTELCRKNRARTLAEIRFAAMYLIKHENKKVSCREIAEKFNLANHSSILHGVTRCGELIDLYRSYAGKVLRADELLQKAIKGFIREVK